MDPVQEQLEAYNKRDLERFVACYGSNALIEDGSGGVIVEGRDAIRGFYATVFAQSPMLHCEVRTRIRVGNYVVDEEFVTGAQLEGFPAELHAGVVYTIDGEQITHVPVFW